MHPLKHRIKATRKVFRRAKNLPLFMKRLSSFCPYSRILLITPLGGVSSISMGCVFPGTQSVSHQNPIPIAIGCVGVEGSIPPGIIHIKGRIEHNRFVRVKLLRPIHIRISGIISGITDFGQRTTTEFLLKIIYRCIDGRRNILIGINLRRFPRDNLHVFNVSSAARGTQQQYW